MNTIQTPYLLQEQNVKQQFIGASDVIRSMFLDLRGGLEQNELQEDNIEAEETEEKIYEKILAFKEIISNERLALAETLAQAEAAQMQKKVELKNRVEVLQGTSTNTAQYQEERSVLLENIRRLETEKKELSADKVEEQRQPVEQSEKEVSILSLENLNAKQAQIEVLSSKIFKLHQLKEKCAVQKDISILKIEKLEETFQSLQQTQRFIAQQTELFSNKLLKKEQQRDETRGDYERIKSLTDTLIESRKLYLENFADQIDTYAKALLDDIKGKLQEQIKLSQSNFDTSIKAVRNSYQMAIEKIQKIKMDQREQNDNLRQDQLKRLQNVLDDYWRYINEGIFQIENVHHREYLYADSHHGYRNGGHRVYTHPEACGWGSGEWLLQQTFNGTFYLVNNERRQPLCLESSSSIKIKHGNKAWGECYYVDYGNRSQRPLRDLYTSSSGGDVQHREWRIEAKYEGIYEINSAFCGEKLFTLDEEYDDNSKKWVTTLGDVNRINLNQSEWRITRKNPY